MRLVMFVAVTLALWPFGQPAAEAQLEVTFSTARTPGRYYPAHVMAAWVTSSDGTFDRTLYVWGARRRAHLSAWTSSHPTSEVLDGITSATLRTDTAQRITWDMRDFAGALVPDGSYVLHLELADTNSTSANYRRQFVFEKRTDGFDQTLEDTPFLAVHFVYTPVEGFDAGPGVDGGPGFDGGAPRFDGGRSGAESGIGPIVPLGRGYGSRGCAASPGRLDLDPGWSLAGLGALVLLRRRRAASSARSGVERVADLRR